MMIPKTQLRHVRDPGKLVLPVLGVDPVEIQAVGIHLQAVGVLSH